jgi:hypothetical protein
MEISKYSKPRKIILIAGIVICLVNLFVIYPLERSTSTTIMEFTFSYIGLGLSIVSILYGLTGGRFIKYLAFILLSVVVSATCWYIYGAGGWFQKFIAFWAGIPCGVITALIFFILRYYIFFRNRELPVGRQTNIILFLMQLVLYFVVLLIVAIVFENGGDWFFDTFEK